MLIDLSGADPRHPDALGACIGRDTAGAGGGLRGGKADGAAVGDGG